ncbi:matrixin family metalloprotease, partial [Thermodesulfobacteriota bacterium]
LEEWFQTTTGIQVAADDPVRNPDITYGETRSIDYTELTLIADEAVKRWNASSHIQGQQIDPDVLVFVITDLPDRALAQALNGIIYIDETAADVGWYVDDSPEDHKEFTLSGPDSSLAAEPDSPAYGRYDILSVVMHEIGHILGLPDVQDPGTLMNTGLSTGLRKFIPVDDLPGGILLTSRNGFNNGAEQSDEEKLVSGLTAFADWADGYGSQIGDMVSDTSAFGDLGMDLVGGIRLPFIDKGLEDIWDITGGQITSLISESIRDEIVSLFTNNDRVSTYDLLALDGISPTLSDELMEFEVNLMLAEFNSDVDLSFDASAIMLPLNIEQSSPIRLSATLELNFIFGLDGAGNFYIEDPSLRGRLNIDHDEPIDVALNLGPVGIGVVDGRIYVDIALVFHKAGRFTTDKLSELAIDMPTISPFSTYNINLPLQLMGALSGLNPQGKQARIIATFNTEESPAPFPDGISLGQFFATIPMNIRTENMGDLLSMKTVSLDTLLEGFKSVLESLIDEDSVAYKKLPIINKSLVELLGSGSTDVVSTLVNVIDTIQESLSNIQRLEITLNQGINSALGLGLDLGGDDVDAAFVNLTTLAPDLTGTSTDDELAIALVIKNYEEDFSELLLDRDIMAAFGRLTDLGLDENASDGELALALADLDILNAIRDERDLVAG